MKYSCSAALAFCLAATLLAATAAIPQTAKPRSDSELVVTVHGPGNRALAGATVQINVKGKAVVLQPAANEDGTYRGPALAAGNYQIVVTAPCFEKFEGSLEVDSNRAPAEAITLTPAPAAAGCAAAGFEFADSGGLKAGEIAGAVDAAGYSSQAEARTTELREALAEVLASGKTGDAAESEMLRRGDDLLRQGHYRQAAGVFRDGTNQYPRSATMGLALGVAYYAGGHYDEAAEALGKAVDLDPTDPRPYFFLAHAEWSSQTQGAAALRRLESYARSHPLDATAMYDYAIALRRQQALGDAVIDARGVERLLRSAVRFDDSFAEAHFELGVALSADHPTDAIAEFERALALQPDWAEAHYRLGQLYQRAGSSDKAQREFAEYDRLRKLGPAARDQRFRDELRRLAPRL